MKAQPSDRDVFYFQQKRGLWQWVRKSPSGLVVDTSEGLGFRTYPDCFADAKAKGLDIETHQIVRK
jgi:hypothetical protein